METFNTVLHQLSISGFAALLLLAALSDARQYLIPNGHVLGILLLYPVYVLTAPQPVAWLAACGIAAGVLVVGFVAFALKWFGGGDVKLLTAAALWAGPVYGLDFMLVTALAGGLVSFAVLLRLNYGWVVGWPLVNASRAVPYGVAIAGGGLYLAAALLLNAN